MCGARRSSLQDMLVNALEARGCRAGPPLWRHVVEHLSWNGAGMLTVNYRLPVGSAVSQTCLCFDRGVMNPEHSCLYDEAAVQAPPTCWPC